MKTKTNVAESGNKAAVIHRQTTCAAALEAAAAAAATGIRSQEKWIPFLCLLSSAADERSSDAGSRESAMIKEEGRVIRRQQRTSGAEVAFPHQEKRSPLLQSECSCTPSLTGKLMLRSKEGAREGAEAGDQEKREGETATAASLFICSSLIHTCSSPVTRDSLSLSFRSSSSLLPSSLHVTRHDAREERSSRDPIKRRKNRDKRDSSPSSASFAVESLDRRRSPHQLASTAKAVACLSLFPFQPQCTLKGTTRERE